MACRLWQDSNRCDEYTVAVAWVIEASFNLFAFAKAAHAGFLQNGRAGGWFGLVGFLWSQGLLLPHASAHDVRWQCSGSVFCPSQPTKLRLRRDVVDGDPSRADVHLGNRLADARFFWPSV